MKKAILTLILALPIFCFSQGNITIHQNPAIQKLIERHVELNATIKRLQGWRIQLISNSDRETVNQVKANFLQNHPNVKTYLTYQQPYFKLRIGDFADKNDAYQLMKEINPDFKGIFVVPDVVNIMPEGSLEEK